MKKIAVICTAISPHLGSEYSVAWNFVTNMSKDNELYVFYGNAGNGFGDFTSIQKWEIDNYNPNLHFINVSLPNNRFYSILKYYSTKHDKSIINFAHIVREKKWHKYAYYAIKKLCDENKIDLIHYLNPIGFKEPGYTWKIKDVPYIWGPISGAHKRAWSLRSCLKVTSQIKTYILRNGLHVGYFKYSPNIHKAIKRCDYIFAATPTTVKQIKMFHKKEAIYLPENGITSMETTEPIVLQPNGIMEIVWIGRIDENKALIILLDALSKVKSKNWHLNIIGNGILFEKLFNHCNKNNLNANITWHGNINRNEVLSVIKKSHLHVITSLGEATTTVLFEAMSCGVPTLSLDHCGMSGVICKKCGIKIPIKNYVQVTTDIGNSIEILISNPTQIRTLSKGALECSKQYLYKSRVNIFNQVYSDAINKYRNLNNENYISK